MLHSIKNIVLLEPKNINILFNCEVFGLLYLIVTKTYAIIIHDNDIKKMETNYMTLSKLINKPIHCIIYSRYYNPNFKCVKSMEELIYYLHDTFDLYVYYPDGSAYMIL